MKKTTRKKTVKKADAKKAAVKKADAKKAAVKKADAKKAAVKKADAKKAAVKKAATKKTAAKKTVYKLKDFRKFSLVELNGDEMAAICNALSWVVQNPPKYNIGKIRDYEKLRNQFVNNLQKFVN